jgi:hypothetical protein
MLKRLLFLLVIVFTAGSLVAQVTTSQISGIVKAKGGEGLMGASVKLTHVPTGTVYSAQSRAGGRFDFPNLPPGGPYKINISFVGFEDISRDDISIALGETSQQDFEMERKATQLEEVLLSTTRRALLQAKGGVETTIGRDKMANLPTVGRNLSDYLRYVPQSKITADGGISLAGQNNRYNSFYIDGAVNNDVFGLAASGTNGGQASIAPISIDAIDQFQVVLSPYDPSIGNFTGGGINAITKSGTNLYTGSVYHFFRSESLSGKTPGVDKSIGTKLPDFSNKTTGFRVGGPIMRNKLFFFLSGEIQRDERPQPFIGTYGGTSTIAQIEALRNYLITTYGYEPGGYLDNPELVEANRVAAKIDWNINNNHKLSGSYRYNDGFRNNVSRSSNSTINFYNNGYAFPTTTNSGSLELNSRFKRNANNKLLLTFTTVKDDRGAIGDPFPRVRINDGNGAIIFGTEEFSTGNLLEQKNYALFDAFRFYSNKHSFTIGTDAELSSSTNIFIRQNYGSYTFADMNTFLTGGTASTYNRSYSLLDPGKAGDESINAAAKFNTIRVAFFGSDEIKVNNNFSVTLGVRADNTNFITTPKEDKFFNDTALAKLSQYYDMLGARSGQISDPRWSINPRVGFIYRLPAENLTFRGGFGTFTGRVPLVWPGGVYNNNGISVGGISRSNVAFRPDPFDQYVASDFGINIPVPSGQVDLIAEDFRMNKIIRASLAMDKNLGRGWKFTVEGIYTKNINEINYTKVSILPPARKAEGPDNRNVYDLSGNFPLNIPLRPNGTTPYTGIFLLSNNKDDKKGYSYSLTTTIDKAWSNNWALNLNYSYGSSVVLNEGTSSQNSSQWQFMESVNGRNYLTRSKSDFDPGHRINAYVAKKFSYLKNKLGTTISLVYNGQSGNTFSYVLNRGMVRDADNFETNDLIFVPTQAQLASMVFLSNTVNGVTYTPDQQKALFNEYIENDKYLRKRRGLYAERNGARLPFTHVADLKLQQDFNLKIGARVYQLQVTYDIFNFTNFLNDEWGKVFFLTNDQMTILSFESFVSSSNYTPQYRFTPQTTSRFNISDGVYNSSRWSSQLGFRLNF